MSLPGTRFLAIARLWFDEAIVDRVVEPLVADWQSEYASAPAHKRGRVWLRGVMALARTTLSVAGHAIRSEALVAPSAARTGALVGAALLVCSAVVLLLNVMGAVPGATPTVLATVVLVVWAAMIWQPNRPATERPLATYLKLSAVLLLIVGFIDGLHAVIVMAPLVLVMWSFKLPAGSPRSEVRRMGLVFGPLALLVVMNPLVNMGSWPMAWRDALHLCWGLWSVVACSLDATRATRAALKSRPTAETL